MAKKSNQEYENSELFRIRHSTAHVMAQAVLEKFPEASINGINLREDENGRLLYYLVIYQDEVRSEIVIDEQGNIMME